MYKGQWVSQSCRYQVQAQVPELHYMSHVYEILKIVELHGEKQPRFCFVKTAHLLFQSVLSLTGILVYDNAVYLYFKINCN